MAALSSRLEDYLETLFHLETVGEKQTVTALADHLKLTKGTIATVVKKMAEQGLVRQKSYGAIQLTPDGRRIGWRVYMKHERLTSFFHDFLGLDAGRGEEIACLIEHHLDGHAAERFFGLVDFLQDAQANQKGWTQELFRSLDAAVRLPAPLTVAASASGRVDRLTGDDNVCRRLAESGVVEGARLDNVRFVESENKYAFEINGRSVALDAAAAATVWIV